MDIMADMNDTLPSVKRARIADTSFNAHGAEASAPAEQQTNDAEAPSQQRAVQDMFGASRVKIPAGVACRPLATVQTSVCAL